MLAASTRDPEGDMSQVHRHRKPHLLAADGFHRWRQLRPFWAGVFLIVASAALVWWSVAPPGQGFHTGLGRDTALIFAVVLTLGAVLVWLAPWQRRVFAALAAAIGLFTAITAHPGGFVCGLVVLVGAAMELSWVAPRSLSETVPAVEAPAAGPVDVLTPAPVDLPAPAPVDVIEPAPPRPAPRPSPLPRPEPVVVPPPATVVPLPPATAVPLRAVQALVQLPELPPAVEPPLLLPPPVPIEVRVPLPAPATPAEGER